MSNDPRMMPNKAHYNGWREPDNVRWHLRNMSTLPALIMPRGDAVYDLPTGTQKDVENFTYAYQGRNLSLGEAMREECIDGYMVVQNGEVLFERYYDNFRAHDHHIWFSMTKSLISTAFGIAQAEFGIDEGRTPADFLPELADSVFATVSVRATAPSDRQTQLVVARYENGHQSEVKAGENWGETLSHSFVVRDWETRTMPSKAPLNVDVRFLPQEKSGGVVAFIEDLRSGEVLQALALPDCHS